MSPAGLYIDENDKVYVVDTLNKRIQVYQYLSEKWKKDHPEEYNKYLKR
jgi:sugar lactone lactonase YvrE